ncbi:hypothetical protein [Clostridium hydrogenum]|uniref:hypothetical protein n=1 Tax=Clostridium hydrogenum TaxID=2855764 RepID=UPI001F1B9DA4|nr:hypothetical protein [Clostridium hydrogenum]
MAVNNNNYRPKAKSVTASAAVSGKSLTVNLTATSWGLFLLNGVAQTPGGTALPSGGVNVWISNALTTGPATYTTFADELGYYGVTIKANVPYVVKYFTK